MKVHRAHQQFAVLKSARRIFCGSAVSLIAALTPTPASAQSVWTATDGVWSNSLNWLGGTVPISGPTTQLRFDAADATSYTTVNDIGAGAFSLNRITVNNIGTGVVTITGNVAANTFSFSGSTPTLDITGTVLFNGLLAGAPTITKTGSGTFIHDSNNAAFTGTLIIDQGTFINRSTTLAVTNFNPVSIVVNNGGIYQFGAASVGDPNLPNSTYITVNTGGNVSWQEGEVFGGFHLRGGNIQMQANVTANGGTPQGWTNGTLGGGNFTYAGTAPINKTTAGTVSLTGGVSVTVTGGLNILEGTVSTDDAANLGTANVTLGDASGTTVGVFEYTGPTAARVGTFTLNEGNGVLRVTKRSTILNLSGSISGTGDVSKTGPGTVQLSGGLGATGTTTVAEGTLQVEPLTALGPFAVNAGAILAVRAGIGAASFAAPSVALTGSNATLRFDLDTNLPTNVPLAMITNPDGLTFSGNPTLRVTNAQAPANGTYTLIDYTGAPITQGFTLALPGRTTGQLLYDAANTEIKAEITGTDTVKWSGAISGDWNVGTAPGVGGTNNWKLASVGTATNFIDTDSVTFDDSATTFIANLTGEVQPASLTVNSAANYTFTGAGKIVGTTGLAKAGSSTLILATNNEYSGGTVVSGGVLQLGNGGTSGSITGGVTLNLGGLGFNRSDDLSFTNAITIAGNAAFFQNGTNTVTIPTPLVTATNNVLFAGSGKMVLGATLSGAGVITKDGPGLLTLLANNNTFTGTLEINGGTALLEDLGAGGDLGAAAIVINNGGTFILGPSGNTDLPDTTLVTINAGGLYRIEQGENFGGVVLNGGELRFVSSVRTGVNSTGIAASPGATVYDFRSGTITTDFTGAGSGGSLNQGSSGVLTKTTAGTVTLGPRVVFQSTLPITIKEGTLAMGVASVPTGGVVLTLGDVTTNGTLRVDDAGSTFTSRPITVEAGGGTFQIADPAGVLNMNTTIVGTGGIVKTGLGTLLFANGNDYLGGTIVSGGILEVNNGAGSGTGTGTLQVAGVLRGNGQITTGAGNSVFITGIFEPGRTGAVLGEDFGIQAGSGGLTAFAPTSIARFDLWSSTGTDQSTFLEAADLLIAGGNFSISSGAKLQLGNPNSLTFQAGDVFRLIDWSAAPSVTGTWTIDATALNLNGLNVDTTQLYTTGTIALLPVPEPASASLLLLGLGAFLSRRHRREPR